MRGVSAIKYHLVTQQHVGNIITTMSSYALPVSFFVRIDFSNIYLLKVVVVSVVVDLQAVRQMKETELAVLLHCMNQRTLNIKHR